MTDATSGPTIAQLREDLALGLRAAAHHGLEEGVCNHFSAVLPDDTRRFLINPRGLHWSEVRPRDIVLVDENGTVLEGRHRVEPTAMFIHASVHSVTGAAVVLHTHMPYATALTLTTDRAIDPTASQGAMRFMGRIAVDVDYRGLALDWAEGERIARAMQGKEVAFLGNHGVVVTGHSIAHAYDDLYYLERACLHQVLAMSTGRPLAPGRARPPRALDRPRVPELNGLAARAQDPFLQLTRLAQGVPVEMTASTPIHHVARRRLSCSAARGPRLHLAEPSRAEPSHAEPGVRHGRRSAAIMCIPCLRFFRSPQRVPVGAGASHQPDRSYAPSMGA